MSHEKTETTKSTEPHTFGGMSTPMNSKKHRIENPDWIKGISILSYYDNVLTKGSEVPGINKFFNICFLVRCSYVQSIRGKYDGDLGIKALRYYL